MSRPVFEMLEAARDTVRFHMPGHKGSLDPHDMTELARTDDLYAPASGILRAEALAAGSCGAANTLMLTGGSTAGLLAMLLSAVPPGRTILMPRNVHHAVLSACVWGDIRAVFSDDIPRAIEGGQEASAVLVTRPDYYGRCVDLARTASMAHARGMLVLADEAHGAHFPWWDTPQSAAVLGADAWVQSAHKTLPALTGAAWLHLGPAMDAARARRFLRMVQTSSPPFPILESLDTARAWMDENGRDALARLVQRLDGVRREIGALGGFEAIRNDDPTRLVIDVRGHGYSGMEIQTILSEMGIDVEMADDACIVCICTVRDTEHAFRRLVQALRAIAPRAPLAQAETSLPMPGPRVCSLREAALGPQEPVPIDAAKGRIAAVSAGMYPPGIPYLLPGEQVTGGCVEKLKRLPPHRRFGVENGRILCMR